MCEMEENVRIKLEIIFQLLTSFEFLQCMNPKGMCVQFSHINLGLAASFEVLTPKSSEHVVDYWIN